MRRRFAEREHVTVSGFFDAPEGVEKTISVLLAGGLPRDLVEVIVSAQADERHYHGRARRLGTLAVPYAAKGALVGLALSILLSLEVLLVPGFDIPERLARVQLFGPNYGAVGGALIGGAIGALRRRQPKGIFVRALDRDGILVAVLDRPREDAVVVARVLRELGAEDVRIDEDGGHPLLAESAAQREQGA